MSDSQSALQHNGQNNSQNNGQFFLNNIWYHAAPARDLKAGKMLALTINGQPVVLVRPQDCNAKPYALRDICPHRGIPLSDGQVLQDGQVECCYHGWQFNNEGKCTCIPSLVPEQEFEVGRIKVRHYPLVERYGQLWLWVGDKEADDSLLPQLPDLGTPKLVEALNFPCHIDHAVIGLMDPAHGPFVHQSWWWRSSRSIHQKAKAFAPSLLGFSMVRHKPSRNSKAYKILGGVPETEIRFQLPGIRIEHVVFGKHQLINLTCVTPVDEKNTRITHSIYWTAPWLTLLKPLLTPYVKAFLGQDKDVVVKQQRGLAYNPSLMLIKDADTMARWYMQLKNEYQRAQAEGRAFENPVEPQTLKWCS